MPSGDDALRECPYKIPIGEIAITLGDMVGEEVGVGFFVTTGLRVTDKSDVVLCEDDCERCTSVV